MEKRQIEINGLNLPAYSTNTLIIGTGAASLNCANHLFNYGQKDIAIVTEKVGGGTSNNTGSDKQTYYKLSVFGKEPDSPYEMAKSLFDGGSMHGDLALIESVMSVQEFFHLVQIGVPFPHNHLGGFVGYKTDHDPRQRATSAGPYTSQQMFQCLLREVQTKGIPIFDDHDVVALLHAEGRVIGAIALDKTNLDTENAGLVIFHAQNVVFGVGGPGGIYKTSVYPECHSGAVGLALEIGARAVNLTESQYGLASVKFRWNVSGTYQQVIPRYFSTEANGGDEQEFLNPYLPTMGKLATDIFLKGYQWPFDPRKIPDYGSSLVDVLVYIETVMKGRRVFMDFRRNPVGDARLGNFSFKILEPEALTYLKNSGVLFGTPIQRLEKMNPMAIELYLKNGIDLHSEPLEVAVCAQHNNGGLKGDIWWESNIRHLFPVGEVNGSHGVYRPGGSALNSGQVGSIRAAQRIAYAYSATDIDFSAFVAQAKAQVRQVVDLTNGMLLHQTRGDCHLQFRSEFQQRMTNDGSHIRNGQRITDAVAQAYAQIGRFDELPLKSRNELPFALQNRHLVLAHAAYLEAIRAYLEKSGGSRGSYLVMDANGMPVLDALGDAWRYKAENPDLRDWMLITELGKNGKFISTWERRRAIPQKDDWFEAVWAEYVKKDVFRRSQA
ncbi:FAD-binding protein [candidate division KSB1 bacterium]|nr:FAD-binding protein [candidate division KSB1 bacterium]